jgi:hypothetical protein
MAAGAVARFEHGLEAVKLVDVGGPGRHGGMRVCDVVSAGNAN